MTIRLICKSDRYIGISIIKINGVGVAASYEADRAGTVCTNEENKEHNSMKKLIAFLLVLLCMVMLCSCDGVDAPAGSQDGPDGAEDGPGGSQNGPDVPPEEGERPTAYVVILTDTTVAKNMKTDVGIVAQTMMLGAAEKGFGGCMIGSVNRENVAEILGIDTERYSIDLVLALGKPAETVKLVDLPENGATNYYRDENGVHYVPKRSVDELII